VSTLPRTVALGLLIAGTAVAAVLAPLWTYALSLALFGLPHVLCELRYVDERFGARVDRATFLWLAAGLAAIVLLRLVALGGIGAADGRTLAELFVGALLLAAAIPLLRRSGHSVLPAALPIVLLLVGAFAAPLATLVVLALLHNLTPVGFLAERLRGAVRTRALLGCAVVFGLVPAALLGGGVEALLAAGALQPTAAGPFATGDVDLHLPVFVPKALLGSAFAYDLFATAAYLQCMHYAVVLLVLPRLSGGSETRGAWLRWPRPGWFAAFVAAAGVGVTFGFASDFAATRGAYAALAALHAWLEIPVLALACGVRPHRAAAPVLLR
jgi:hypothetical protein